MNSDGSKIHNILEKTTQTSSESERKKLAEEANKLHEKATGHPMKIDEHGNIETKSEEAKSCPALH
ncbi:unnamed protein product [Mucor hiemalis]